MRKSGKYKASIKKSFVLNMSPTKEDVYRFLNKNPNFRNPQEINLYAKYLSQNFQYFTKLKETIPQYFIDA